MIASVKKHKLSSCSVKNRRMIDDTVLNPFNPIRVDGELTLTENFGVYENYEFFYSGWDNRDTLEFGDDPSDIPTNKSFNIAGLNIELYRCIIHDYANVGFWSSSKGIKLTECIIYFNGWSGGDRGHGCGAYVQNYEETKIFERCIIFWNFSNGLKFYGSSGHIFRGITIKDCVFFDTGRLYTLVPSSMRFDLLIAGNAEDQYSDVLIQGNEIYRKSDNIGVPMILGMEDSVMNYDIKDNYVVGNVDPSGIMPCLFYPTGGQGSGDVSGNTFYGSLIHVAEGDIPDNTFGIRPLSGKRTRVIKCNGKRAHVIIYNYDNSSTVDIDVTGILSTSEGYKLTNVQDLFNDIIVGVVGKNNIIKVPMTGRTTATPIKWIAPPNTFPEFGCFILEENI